MSIATRHPFLVHRCLRKFEAVLDSHEVQGEPVLLGVSGGSDSMALLELSSLAAPARRLRLHVACVNHGLRPEAESEVVLAGRAADRAGATFHAIRVEPEGDDEDSLRRARHDALERVRVDAGARFVLLGHTADDQVETIVFRFLRGAGPGGLAGMRERRGTLLRPLLGMRREELREVLRLRGTPWADDPTNDTERYARGRLRGSVLPAVEAAFGRGALDHLLDVAPRWQADEDCLEQEAARLFAYAARHGRGHAQIDLDVEALSCGHVAVRARVLRRWILDRTGRMPTSRDIGAIERWIDSEGARGGHLDLAGARLERSGGRLSVVRPGLAPGETGRAPAETAR